MFTVKVMFVGLVILIIVAIYMLGRMKKIFDSLNADLPVVTKLLLGLGDFAIYYIWLLPFIIIGLIIIFKYMDLTNVPLEYSFKIAETIDRKMQKTLEVPFKNRFRHKPEQAL